MTQANRVRARLFQLIASASDDELFRINDTLAGAGHLDLSRCSKPGSPFPLFDLPLELLEYSADFFSQPEAASVLTANRLFHDVFARVVWCSIRIWKVKCFKIKISALSRYGHLVNQLKMGMDGYIIKRIASLVPNVITASIYDDEFGSCFQAGQLDLLRNLRTLTICVSVLNKTLLGSIRDWINNDSLSGYVNEIEFDCVNAKEWLMELLSLYNSIISKKRIRIKFDYIGRTIPNDFLKDVASSLVQTYLLYSVCSGCHRDSIYRPPNVTFPLLTELYLAVCCVSHGESRLLGMTSVRFPSVRTLSLDIDDNDCAHQNYPALPIILSHTWPSVKSLRVSGSIKQDDHVYIALAMPNLIILDYARSINNYDLADLLPKFKLLQLLTLRNYHTRPDIVLSSTIIMPNEVMSRLRSIRLREVALTADMVRFIFYCCPNLMELKIGGCSIFSDVVKYANEVSMNGNSPVRHLRIKRYYLDEELDLWVEFISNFKNLKEIMIDNACEGAGYLGGKLTELFPCAKVKYY